MTALVFVDTNVLIYAQDSANLKKQKQAQAWRRELWLSGAGRVSFQVLQEFYVNIIQRWPDARGQARAEVRDLVAWNPVRADTDLIERAWVLQDRYQLSFWGSLIVAAAKTAACRYLLTEDLQDGQNFDGLRVINPFRNDPASVLQTRGAD
jgi:predicted nucleic acid-binding protein